MTPTAAPAKAQPSEKKQFRWEAITAISTLVLAAATLFVLVFTGRQINEFHDCWKKKAISMQKTCGTSLAITHFNINEDAKPLLEKERRDDVAGWLSG